MSIEYKKIVDNAIYNTLFNTLSLSNNSDDEIIKNMLLYAILVNIG